MSFTINQALASLAGLAVKNQTIAEQMITTAIVAIMRGAAKDAITSTIENAAATRGVKNGNARQISGIAYSLATYVVTAETKATVAAGTLVEAVNAVTLAIYGTKGKNDKRTGGFLDGASERSLWDMALAADPVRAADKAKRDKAKEDKATADAEAEAKAKEAKDAADAAAETAPNITIADVETYLDAAMALVAKLTPEERDALTAHIHAMSEQPIVEERKAAA